MTWHTCAQRVLVVARDNSVHLVPYVEDTVHLVLKPVIPSSEATRSYLEVKTEWRRSLVSGLDPDDTELLGAYERGELTSIVTKWGTRPHPGGRPSHGGQKAAGSASDSPPETSRPGDAGAAGGDAYRT